MLRKLLTKVGLNLHSLESFESIVENYVTFDYS